jgi:release factor glutamine methyltransferase
MTLREAVQWGEEQLKNAPRESHARRDAEWLLLTVVGRDKAWLMAHDDEALHAADFEKFSGLIERRATGEPMQYIIGQCEFFGLPFKVTPAVLIPRPETEHLVEVMLEKAHKFQGARIVDVGTGSGAIAVTLALKSEGANVTAIDLSADALSVARENASRNIPPNIAKVRFLQGDLLEPVASERFDFVVSNPPYVPDVEKAWLSVDVRDHEPHLALFGGEDGLEIYRRLIPQAKDVLVSGGWLVMEMGFGQGERVQNLMEQMEFKEIEIVQDLQGIERIILGRK